MSRRLGGPASAVVLLLLTGWAAAQTPPKPDVGRGGMGGQRTAIRRGGPGGATRGGGPAQGGAQAGAQGGAQSGAEGASGRGPSVADALLRQGSYRAAVAAFTKELAKTPEAPATHIGLGRALSRVGRCAEALDHFWPYVDTKPFGEEAALAASVCSSRLALYDDALTFDRIGLSLDDENARLLTQYALDLDVLGAIGERDDILDRLLVAKPDRDASAYARAVIALRRGDIDTLDEVLYTWTGDDNARAERVRLEAQSWLDVGDPQQAVVVAAKVKMRQRGVQLRDIRAEALRRIGDPANALDIPEGRQGKRVDGGDTDAFRARLEVDTGDLKGATERLADYLTTSDPDMLASLWYLARAKGDAPSMTEYAARYRVVEKSPLRVLDQLVPFARPAPQPARAGARSSPGVQK